MGADGAGQQEASGQRPARIVQSRLSARAWAPQASRSQAWPLSSAALRLHLQVHRATSQGRAYTDGVGDEGGQCPHPSRPETARAASGENSEGACGTPLPGPWRLGLVGTLAVPGLLPSGARRRHKVLVSSLSPTSGTESKTFLANMADAVISERSTGQPAWTPGAFLGPLPGVQGRSTLQPASSRGLQGPRTPLTGTLQGIHPLGQRSSSPKASGAPRPQRPLSPLPVASLCLLCHTPPEAGLQGFPPRAAPSQGQGLAVPLVPRPQHCAKRSCSATACGAASPRGLCLETLHRRARPPPQSPCPHVEAARSSPPRRPP